MGPRSLSAEIMQAIRRTAVLQRRFNGAALFERGNRLVRRRQRRRPDHASMGPRSVERGNLDR